MSNRSLSLFHFLAAGFWVKAMLLITAGLVVDRPGVGHFGLLCVGVAVTLHFRAFVCELVERERNAFELGRDSMGPRWADDDASEGRVRSLR